MRILAYIRRNIIDQGQQFKQEFKQEPNFVHVRNDIYDELNAGELGLKDTTFFGCWVLRSETIEGPIGFSAGPYTDLKTFEWLEDE